jgi:hypothetical protein
MGNPMIYIRKNKDIRFSVIRMYLKGMKWLIISVPILFLLISCRIYAQTPQRIQQSFYRIDSQGKRVPTREIRNQYDREGRVRLSQVNEFDEITQTYRPVNRIETDYDDAGREVRVLQTTFEDTSPSIRLTRLEQSIYNDDKLIELKITETVPSSGKVMETRQNYEYAENGCLKTEDFQEYVNGSVGLRYTVNYQNDDQCRKLKVLTTYSESFSTALLEIYEYISEHLTANRQYTLIGEDSVLNFELIYAYNDSGLLILEKRTEEYKIELTYGSSGKTDYRKVSTWNPQTLQWNLASETFYTYSAEGLLLETDAYFESNEGGYRFQNLYEYNEEGRVIRITTIRKYAVSTGNIDAESERLFYYRCDGAEVANELYSGTGVNLQLIRGSESVYLYPASCETSDKMELTVYPNPTTGMVTVIPADPTAVSSVSVYTEHGQLVNTFGFAEGLVPIQMDLSPLADGIYFITVSNGSQFAASRLVKIGSGID